jgi:hypothetical protein
MSNPICSQAAAPFGCVLRAPAQRPLGMPGPKGCARKRAVVSNGNPPTTASSRRFSQYPTLVSESPTL